MKKPLARKKAVIIFGPPGSGKSTQGKLVSEKFGFFNLDTGRILESALYNPAHFNDKEIKKERNNFETGKLVSTPFVLKILSEKIRFIAANEMGIVFSGSPRTMIEAFGDSRLGLEGEMSVLGKAYGKKNVVTIVIRLSEEGSMKRNGSRMICSVCQTPILGILNLKKQKSCPFCGGKLYRRTLDDPKIIKARLEEYRRQTFPLIKELKKKNFPVYSVNGNPMPYQVFSVISGILHGSTQNRKRNSRS